MQEAYSGRSLALNLGGDLLEGELRLGGVRLGGVRLLGLRLGGDLERDLRAAKRRGRGEIDLRLGEAPTASLTPLRSFMASRAAAPDANCSTTPAGIDKGSRRQALN